MKCVSWNVQVSNVFQSWCYVMNSIYTRGDLLMCYWNRFSFFIFSFVVIDILCIDILLQHATDSYNTTTSEMLMRFVYICRRMSKYRLEPTNVSLFYQLHLLYIRVLVAVNSPACDVELDVDASTLFSRLCSAISLRTLCSAAMIRCRCMISEQFLQVQSFHLHKPLCPFKGQITPWFLQRAHFGDTIVFSRCLFRFSVFRTTVVVYLLDVLMCEQLCASDLIIWLESYIVVGNFISVLLPLNIVWLQPTIAGIVGFQLDIVINYNVLTMRVQ
jgi:hypothetical protein